MNKNINLCEILEGHEGEIFYNPYYGDIKLSYIDDKFIVFNEELTGIELFIKHNGCSFHTNEPAVFPSKNQHDWNIWFKEQKPKTPKTWSELVVNKHSPIFAVELKPVHNGEYQNYHYTESIWGGTSIEKSALALLKIHQLIEVGYGGNITKKYVENLPIDKTFYFILYNHDVDKFIILSSSVYQHNTINFKTKEQAKEFLSYEENIQLLKDYFMI